MALQSMLFSFLKILLCVLLFYLVDISYFIITVRNYILFKTENFFTSSKLCIMLYYKFMNFNLIWKTNNVLRHKDSNNILVIEDEG